MVDYEAMANLYWPHSYPFVVEYAIDNPFDRKMSEHYSTLILDEAAFKKFIFSHLEYMISRIDAEIYPERYENACVFFLTGDFKSAYGLLKSCSHSEKYRLDIKHVHTEWYGGE